MADAAITCVAAGPDDRIFAGDASGSVRCFSARPREAEPAAGGSEAVLEWAARATPRDAILSICAVADARASSAVQDSAKAAARANVLLVVGAASGELVFFRNATEVRRVQLDSAVLAICAHGRDGEFLVGDLLGSLYGVDEFGVRWQERPEKDAPHGLKQEVDGAQELAAPAFFFPAATQPTVRAIASVRELDVENTLSSYALVSTGQRHLLLAHRGRAFARVATPTPVGTIATLAGAAAASTAPGDKQQQQSDVVLVAGEAGKVYRISTVREPAFAFAVDVFAEVAFAIAKLLAIDSATSTWACLGEHGQFALFRGSELVREWHATPSGGKSSPVDAAVVRESSADASSPGTARLAIAFPDRVEFESVSLS